MERAFLTKVEGSVDLSPRCAMGEKVLLALTWSGDQGETAHCYLSGENWRCVPDKPGGKARERGRRVWYHEPGHQMPAFALKALV